MEIGIEPFEFMQCVSILKSTGKFAKNLGELRTLISESGDESIFHHTHQYFIKGLILEYTNDFAEWAGATLEERALAERLSCIDPYILKSVSEVRKKLIREIDGFLADCPEPRDVLTGNEFYLNETVSLVFPVGVTAENLEELLIIVEHIDKSSIYYHFFDSRFRLGEGVVDDFSRWIEHGLGKQYLAEKIRAIDPFVHSIESIRTHIIEVIEAHLRTKKDGTSH
ncbi:MAG TPA: hypothetical protein ENG88_00410 [Nitrospirae bacterium]|nr:hypothetical protein [Nitrospirota bacterium]